MATSDRWDRWDTFQKTGKFPKNQNISKLQQEYIKKTVGEMKAATEAHRAKQQAKYDKVTEKIAKKKADQDNMLDIFRPKE